MPAPPCARVRDCFLRLLGVVFLLAFLSLLAQVTLLFGREGLLPAERYLEGIRRVGGALTAPTLFWIGASDGALRGVALAGAVISVGLIVYWAPRYCLFALWALYLSFVTVGQDFLSFQWDNLLLESAFLGLFVTPGGLRPRSAPAPHPIGVFLMRWLVFRLNFESGAAKLLTGDPTWRDLTALASYYETAPLPTWLGWYAHQMPLWAHRLCSLWTLVVEIVLALLIWGPRRLKVAAWAAMVAMQLSILLTGNYGFFNYLTLALSLFILDDGHLAWAARRVGWTLTPAPAQRPRRLPTALLAAAALVLVPLSAVPFLRFVSPPRDLVRALGPLDRALDAFRSINAYHLFASMTLVRNEVVIEGSNDGATWLPYEFRYKPGDPARPPPIVAPHQPRVDFQLWFLLLGGPPRAPYFATLLQRLFDAPAVVAPLFARDPFAGVPPKLVRLAIYRYRFSDVATRRTTGAWWTRELQGYSRPLTAESVRK